MRKNPRQSWYHNLKEVTTNGDYEAAFVLGRVQPSFIALLVTGWSRTETDQLRFGLREWERMRDMTVWRVRSPNQDLNIRFSRDEGVALYGAEPTQFPDSLA